MTVRIEDGKDVFELNNGLSKMFPKLDSAEMEYVIHVADSNSIFRMKSDGDKRLLALKLCEGLWYGGKITVKGQRILDKKNKDVERGIVTYHSDINNNKRKKISDTIDVLDSYLDAQLDFIKSLKDIDDVDEKVKVYNATAKSIKEETIKSTYDQIKYFEKELSFEYDIPDSIIDDTKEVNVVDTNTADNVNVEQL